MEFLLVWVKKELLILQAFGSLPFRNENVVNRVQKVKAFFLKSNLNFTSHLMTKFIKMVPYQMCCLIFSNKCSNLNRKMKNFGSSEDLLVIFELNTENQKVSIRNDNIQAELEGFKNLIKLKVLKKAI